MTARPSRELTRSERAKIRKLVTETCANYDGRERQCFALDCPCYMLGAGPALQSALTGEDSSMRQKECPVCGKAYLPVTSQAYCSAACRAYARRKSKRERKRRERLGKG